MHSTGKSNWKSIAFSALLIGSLPGCHGAFGVGVNGKTPTISDPAIFDCITNVLNSYDRLDRVDTYSGRESVRYSKRSESDFIDHSRNVRRSVKGTNALHYWSFFHAPTELMIDLVVRIYPDHWIYESDATYNTAGFPPPRIERAEKEGQALINEINVRLENECGLPVGSLQVVLR